MVKRFTLVTDLGSKVDSTTIGVIETIEDCNHEFKRFYSHCLIDLFVYKKMKWTELIPIFKKFYELPGMKNAPIIVDGNGVGDVVISFMKQAGLVVIPVISTRGESESINSETGAFHVSKKVLAQTFMQTLSYKKWSFAENLMHKKELLLQFENFTTKTSSAGIETFENAQASVHDDIVTMCLIGVYVLRKIYIDVFANKFCSAKRNQKKYNPRRVEWRKK